VTAVAFHPEGQSLAVATIKGEIYVWRIEDCQLLGIIDAEVQGGRSYFSKITAENDSNNKYLKTLTYSHCGKYLIGGGKSRYLYFYDIAHSALIDKI
jgi:WD40 repeat protein